MSKRATLFVSVFSRFVCFAARVNWVTRAFWLREICSLAYSLVLRSILESYSVNQNSKACSPISPTRLQRNRFPSLDSPVRYTRKRDDIVVKKRKRKKNVKFSLAGSAPQIQCRFNLRWRKSKEIVEGGRKIRAKLQRPITRGHRVDPVGLGINSCGNVV